MVKVNVLELKTSTKEDIVANKKCYVVQGYCKYESYPLGVYMDKELAQKCAEKAAKEEYDAAEVIAVDFEEKTQYKKLGDR